MVKLGPLNTEETSQSWFIQQQRQETIERNRKEKLKAERLKQRSLKNRLIREIQSATPTDSRRTGFALGRNIQQAGQRPTIDFSTQQDVMNQVVGGGGEKIWGINNQPVRINKDLGGGPDPSTAEMFGFG